jgi:hypothetical protein|tara:strand:- start:2196 stop:3380 length:1185 start_codon:yes stop_codon:yes gene_type:complete
MSNNIIVDVNSTKKFTEENLATYKKLIVPEAYPWLFGEDLLPALKIFSSESIVDVDDVNWLDSMTEQTARNGGKNPKLKEIARDIGSYGFKLTNPAVALFRKKNGELIPINGRSRKEILVGNHDFTNIIAIIYEAEDDATEDEVENACSAFGLLSNSYSDPAGDLQMEDVFNEVQIAIAKGWISFSGEEVDFPLDITAIRNRVDLVCGKGCFTPTKREQLVYRIYNTNNPQFVVKSWTRPSETALWMKKYNIIDIKPVNGKRGIMYVCLSAETGEKSIIAASRYSYEKPDYDIRVIIHTGTLTGFALEENYMSKVTKFRDFWDATLLRMSYGFFGNKMPTKTPISLYGVLPALSSIHNLTKLVKIVAPSLMNNMTGLEQSDDGGKILFDIDEAA